MNNPNFFIVGAPKCGTTALASYLEVHPEVFMASPKEPHHFNTDHDHRPFSNEEDYFALFDGAGPGIRRIGEASVWYLYSREAIPNIEQRFDQPLYIVMLRNPVLMAPSLHEQLVFSGNESITSFEQAWRAQDERRQGRNIPRFANDASFLLYHQACCLGAQLERMLETVPRDRILILFQEDMARDPGSIWRSVQDFLGLSLDDRQEFPTVNAAKARRWPFLKRLNDWYSLLVHKYKMPPLRLGIGTKLDRYDIKSKTRAPLSEDLRAEMISAFSDDIAKLSKLTGRDLSHWLR